MLCRECAAAKAIKINHLTSFGSSCLRFSWNFTLDDSPLHELFKVIIGNISSPFLNLVPPLPKELVTDLRHEAMMKVEIKRQNK